jgi:hypothetical protein
MPPGRSIMTLMAQELFDQATQSAATDSDQRLTLRRVPESEWDATALGFDGVCQEQLVAFSGVRWPGVALEPLVFENAGKVVGGALVMVQPMPLGLGAIAVVKWGPMLARENVPGADALWRAMVQALFAEFAGKRRMLLSILPRATTGETSAESAWLAEKGFALVPELLFPDRYIVNLRLDDAAQRKSFAQKWRYHHNRAEKAGLVFERAGPEAFPAFDALYSGMLDRKRFADHSAYQTVPGLLAIPDAGLRPELFLVRHKGEAVAGAIIFKAGDRAVYLYGATNAAALDLRAGYFLHWHVIRWLRDNTSARWYDLGGTDGFEGLHRFKKGMVGSAGVVRPVPPVALKAAHLLPWLIGRGAFAARAAHRTVTQFIERRRPDLSRPDQKRGDDAA